MARWPWLLALLMVLVSGVVRWELVNSEFGRNGDGTGALFGIAARNYVARGWRSAETLWMPVISVGKDTTVYAHHPATVPLAIAAGVWAAGDRELGVRLQAYVCTLGAMLAVFGLMRPRAGVLGALLACGVMGFGPLSMRYGQMPDVVNSQLVLMSVLVLWAYVRWVEERGRMWVWLVALGGVMVTDWPGFYWGLVLGVHLLVTRPGGWKKGLVWTGVLGVGLFGVLYVWSSLATGDWGLIVRQFLNRSAQAQSDLWHAYTLSEWAGRVWRWNGELFGWGLWGMAVLGWVMVVWCRPHRGMRALVLLPAGWALVHVVVGRQAVWMHQWWWWPVGLALAVSAGSVMKAVGAMMLRAFPPLRVAVYGVVVGVIAAVCGLWCAGELRHLRSAEWRLGEIGAYSPRELGQAVRAAAPWGRAVMVFEKDEQPYVTYYADRPVIQKVWDRESLETGLRREYADLFYTFRERITEPPAALVVPKVYEGKAGLVRPVLEERCEKVEVGKFDVYEFR